MTINPQLTGHDQFDVLQGSVTNHFARIESVLLQNECINGQYNLVTSASYAANTPVVSPGFTKVCISTNGSIIADLENSYIEADLEYTLQLKGPNNLKNAKLIKPSDQSLNDLGEVTKFFIGFKQSLDALERYDIYCNAQLLYSQPFVGPESFVTLAGLNDTIRKNNPYVYTAYENAATMDQAVCGVYVDLKDVNSLANSFTIKIPVKINLHQFLLLSPIHYLPSFAGRWEIQLYFGSKNLVICPVHPSAYVAPQDASNAADIHSDGSWNGNKWVGWCDHFVQIGDPFYVYNTALISGSTTTYEIKWDQATLTCSNCVLTECLVNITQFQLRYEVYQALMAHYIENPMIIPTNTLSYQRFAHSTGSGQSAIHAVANLPVENIDSMFLLLPETDTQQTCFYQPYLDGVRMSLGEFGIRPQQYMCTYGDGSKNFQNRRFVTYLLDALNLENSQISAMNKDFINSVLPHATLYTIPAAGGAGNGSSLWTRDNFQNKWYDNSHFMIGFPLSQVGFQSGTVSSPSSNINFQFDANIMDIPGQAGHKIEFLVPVIAMFLVDCEIMIQVIPNSDQPVVKLSSKSIV